MLPQKLENDLDLLHLEEPFSAMPRTFQYHQCRGKARLVIEGMDAFALIQEYRFVVGAMKNQERWIRLVDVRHGAGKGFHFWFHLSVLQSTQECKAP